MSGTLTNDILLRRSRHVVSEHNRVIEAITYLQQSNLARFGQLMYDSHQSLRDDYQVSTERLDFLVEKAMSFDGTLGSRLTGAGFGGCTVNLVRGDRVDMFCKTIGDAYQHKFTARADFYPIKVADGVREI